MPSNNLPIHIPTAFKKGDRVRVARIVKEARAWHEPWAPEATTMMGNIVVVDKVDRLRGFFCGRKKGLKGAWLPSPALEPIGAVEAVVIIMPSV